MKDKKQGIASSFPICVSSVFHLWLNSLCFAWLRLGLTMMYLPDDRYASFSPDGHYTGSPKVERDLVYVVQTAAGVQHTLTPAEFATKYGWKNDPEKVRLVGKQVRTNGSVLPSPAINPGQVPCSTRTKSIRNRFGLGSSGFKNASYILSFPDFLGAMATLPKSGRLGTPTLPKVGNVAKRERAGKGGPVAQSLNWQP